MWHLHQTAKLASHYYSNTGWRSVLKLQNSSTSTPHHDRDCHSAPDKTKEGCAPHRLSICTAITHIRKSRRLHLTKFNTRFKQPDIKNSSRTSMDTCTYRHTWKQTGGSAGERGNIPKQDTLRLLSRHKQTLIFRHRTGHCRLRSHMKKISIEKSRVMGDFVKYALCGL